MMHTDIVRLLAGVARIPEYDFRVGEDPGTKQEMEGFAGRRLGVYSEPLEGHNGNFSLEPRVLGATTVLFPFGLLSDP
jgi:hypothetical protein